MGIYLAKGCAKLVINCVNLQFPFLQCFYLVSWALPIFVHSLASFILNRFSNLVGNFKWLSMRQISCIGRNCYLLIKVHPHKYNLNGRSFKLLEAFLLSHLSSYLFFSDIQWMTINDFFIQFGFDFSQEAILFREVSDCVDHNYL